MSSVALPKDFGYVAGVVAASWALHHGWMAFKVVAARKKYNVEYPALYAPDSNAHAKEFNCVQRAHQNSLENQPITLALLTVAGLQYPITAASFGALCLAGRVGYFNGYATGDPAKRMNPLTGCLYVGTLGLVGTVAKMTYDLLSR